MLRVAPFSDLSLYPKGCTNANQWGQVVAPCKGKTGPGIRRVHARRVPFSKVEVSRATPFSTKIERSYPKAANVLQCWTIDPVKKALGKNNCTQLPLAFFAF